MYKYLLCTRYLRTRYIALTCIISVTLGVATMIVVNSVMSGFSSQMKERIRGILADVVLETGSADGERDPDWIMSRIDSVAGQYIEAMSPTVEVYGMLSFQYYGQTITKPVTIIGIEPESKAKMGTLTEHLFNYMPQRDDEGNIIGPPRYTSDVTASFDLHPQDQENRRLVKEQEVRMRQHSQRMQELKQASHEDDGPFAGGDIFDGAQAVDSDGNIIPEEEPADLFSPLPGRVYIGSELVTYKYMDQTTGKLKTMPMVRKGDDIQLSTVSAGQPPDAIHMEATVIDYFKCGMSEYDNSLIFCNLDWLQDNRGMLDPESGTRSVTSVQIKLKDGADPATVVKLLRSEFEPGRFAVHTWEQKQGPLLAAVEVESAILNVLLFLIIAVAGFGILAIFFMIVVEKTRDIGILKSLGASSTGVMSIFLAYGFGLGMVGAGAGVSLGLLFVWQINWIEEQITWLTGQEVFDERIYYFPEIPTNVEPWMVFWVAVGAIGIAVLASILPARRASRLNPVTSLRYE